MKGRLSENVVQRMTTVNPPPVQEMNSVSEAQDFAPPSAYNSEHTKLEMQALKQRKSLYIRKECSVTGVRQFGIIFVGDLLCVFLRF